MALKELKVLLLPARQNAHSRGCTEDVCLVAVQVADSIGHIGIANCGTYLRTTVTQSAS
jgi:hypothetical protein